MPICLRLSTKLPKPSIVTAVLRCSRKPLSDALTKTGRDVFVVVDDVDRLDPPEHSSYSNSYAPRDASPESITYLPMTRRRCLMCSAGLNLSVQPRKTIDYMENTLQVHLDLSPVRPRAVGLGSMACLIGCLQTRAQASTRTACPVSKACTSRTSSND